VAIEAVTLEAVGRRIDSLWPQLNERQRRALLGAEARELGWGGVSAVARVTGVARSTITTAVAELESPEVLEPGRSRRSGGGRKSATVADPGLAAALDALVDPTTRGGQPARRDGGNRSVKAAHRCLIQVDRFRRLSEASGDRPRVSPTLPALAVGRDRLVTRVTRPGDKRLSRRDLWEPEGETPSGYPTLPGEPHPQRYDIITLW